MVLTIAQEDKTSARFARAGRLVVLAAFALPGLSACGQPVKEPEVQQNPAPTERYEITLQIDDAPGPFDSVTATTGYQVSNDRCIPMTPGSGATLTPRKYLPLPLTRVDEHHYKGTFYVDRFLDEDYYGLGVCHWEMMAVDVDMKAGKMSFSPGFVLKDIRSRRPVVTYLSKWLYARAHDPKATPISDSGHPRREDYKEPANTFSVTMTASEPVP